MHSADPTFLSVVEQLNAGEKALAESLYQLSLMEQAVKVRQEYGSKVL